MGREPVPYSPPECPYPLCGPGNPPPTDFSPAHTVRLSSFFIDRQPVTNGEYRRCFEAGGCPDECQGCYGDFFNQYRMDDPRLEGYPVATATAEGAEAYCRWVGKRLPTEAEWGRAARGPRPTDYPWGNDPPDCTRYRCEEAPSPFGWTRTWFHPVGSNTGDVSAEGVQEMVTAAPEIVADGYSATYYSRSPVEDPKGPDDALERVLRGNVYIGDALAHSLTYNGTGFPLPAWVRRSGSVGGIRCARSDTDAADVPEGFWLIRQRLVAGERLGDGEGGAR